MKFIALVFVGAASILSAGAQTKKSDVKAPEPLIPKEAIISSFESTLADGKVRFTKKLTENSSGAMVITYYMRTTTNTAASAGSPTAVQLSKESFTGFFEKINGGQQKLPLLVKFVQEKKLSFSDEQTWAKAVAYYNSLD